MIERRYRGEWSDPSYRLGLGTTSVPKRLDRQGGKRFDAAKAAFRPVVQALRPLHRHGEGESAFRGLFQRVEVLPRGLYKEYDKHLRYKHYLLATQLLVPILLGTFYALNSARGLTSLKDALLMADVCYDHELGLLSNEVDLDAVII